ncbi:hypothetical protein BST61_g3857 [Cercospora zeina]
MAGTTPPAKKMKTGEAVLDGRIHDPIPTFDMEDIYDTKLVKIVVGNPDRHHKTFSVSREQVCAHSTYFAAAFKKDFKEAHEKTIAIQQFAPEFFAIFLTFIHTFDITFNWHSHTAGIPDTKDPTTWYYRVLVECYVLGDYIGARAFRDRILETIQIKLMQHKKMPSGEAIRAAYNGTPENSQLRKVLVDGTCARQMRSADIRHHYNDREGPPMQFMADCQYRMSKLAAALACAHCSPLSSCDHTCDSKYHTREDAMVGMLSTWCKYHEHETEEQKELCKWKVRALKKRLDQESGEGGDNNDEDD